MESADQALYTAKEIGRDCSVIFAPDVTAGVSGHARRRRARGEARLLSLVTLAESLDADEHSTAVGRHAREIGRQIGYPEERLDKLVLAGVLHDVGKVGISEFDRDEARAPDPNGVGRDAQARRGRREHARGHRPRRPRGLGPLPP